MTNIEIARRRMRNSRLTGAPFETPDETVRWHGAMQAQDYGPAKWSIGQRCSELVDEDLDHVLAAGLIVRTHVLRPTWHFVARDDIRWMLALTGPRVQRHNEPRYQELGLDKRTIGRCEAVITAALEGGNRLTRDAIGDILDEARLDHTDQRLPYILMHCELEAAICSGGLSGKKHTYALFDERVPTAHPFDRDAALVELVWRYLRSHGPATVRDLRWWSSLTVADIKNALGMLGSEVRADTIDDVTFWSIASNERPPRQRRVHLLQIYDEFLVGYTESRYFGDPRAQIVRAGQRDRRLPTGVVLLGGRVAGHWRRAVATDLLTVEVLLYEELRSRDENALKAATRDLGRFLGRHVAVETALL